MASTDDCDKVVMLFLDVI